MNFSVRVAGLTVNFSYANLISPEIPNSLDCWILSILITPLYPKPNVCRSKDPGYPFYFIDSYWSTMWIIMIVKFVSVSFLYPLDNGLQAI